MTRHKDEPSHRASIMIPVGMWWWLGERARVLGHSGRSGLIRAIIIAYRKRAVQGEPVAAGATTGEER